MPGKILERQECINMAVIDKRILAIAKQVKKRRPRIVIDHIIQYGFITTEEIRDLYGYNHPPRAIRDVREEGIPKETYKVVDSNGRKIAAYRFGNPDSIERHKLGGRKVFSKQFKRQLLISAQKSKLRSLHHG